MARVITNRASLFQLLLEDRTVDDVMQLVRAYSPPSVRIVIRSLEDFQLLGATPDRLHEVLKELTGPDGRVMGVEGISSLEMFRENLEDPAYKFKVGHLSHACLKSKIASGEWSWRDEENCILNTMTCKPCFLRKTLCEVGLHFVVRRHEEWLPEELRIARGDVIIFDIDATDPFSEQVNRRVFVQETCYLAIHSADSLTTKMWNAIEAALQDAKDNEGKSHIQTLESRFFTDHDLLLSDAACASDSGSLSDTEPILFKKASRKETKVVAHPVVDKIDDYPHQEKLSSGETSNFAPSQDP
eukprot:GEMP01029541.1.p1 GENE.GEMP01029541.1~~GEMP01029541.1.p1  ORF type:complete len:350 (+),score=30.98 GEMP01029541.1:152-1051(+)